MASEVLKMSRQAAIDRFRSGRPSMDSEPANDFERQLRDRSVGLVTLGVSKDDFAYFHNLFDVVLEEHREALAWTRGHFNKDGVPEDGHVRKELKFNDDNQQISDPKDIFHFNNALLAKYAAVNKHKMPKEFAEFMDTGFNLWHELGTTTIRSVALLGESYKGIESILMENGITSYTMREIRYDKDDPALPPYYRAKEHVDRGFATLQADETSSGLWMKLPGQTGDGYPPIAVPHDDGYSRLFFGVGMNVIYGPGEHPISPMTHGVYGPQPGDGTRNSTILFDDPPFYDLDITSLDTQPHRKDTDALNV